MRRIDFFFIKKISICFFLGPVLQFQLLSAQEKKQQVLSDRPPEEVIAQRADAYKNQLENYLRQWIVDGYSTRSEEAWHRDYSSIGAFTRSVEPNREKWKEVMNPPELKKTGPLKKAPHQFLEDIHAEWVQLPLGPITAEGILVFPANASKEHPVPLIVAQHGIGSIPESLFYINDETYHSYARELVKAGFAVLAPMNLPAIERRNYIERLCSLIDTTLPGIELARMQHLLDVVIEDPRIDQERVGMWGLSLGGMATMFWMPLEPRFKAGVVSAWYNGRLGKMAIPDPRYSCFLVTSEDHAFFNGWLTEFSDHDVVSLICPRPLLIQHGKSDGIAHWPFVVEEFDKGKSHYEKLNIADRMEIDLFEGVHESRIESGVGFLKKWLMR